MSRLSEAIQESGLKKQTIALQAGITNVMLSEYMKKARPRVDRAISIAKTLGKTVEEIWGEEECK